MANYLHNHKIEPLSKNIKDKVLTPVESATNSYKSVYMHNTCSFHQEVASTSGLHYDIYKNRHAFIRTNAIVDTAIQGQSGSL